MADNLNKGQKDDLACTYAAWLLHDGGVEVSADNLQSVLEAAGLEVPAFYTKIYAKALVNVKLADLVKASTTVGGGAPAAAAAPAAGGAAPAAAAAAAPKEEEKEEEEEDFGGGGGLFGDDEDY